MFCWYLLLVLKRNSREMDELLDDTEVSINEEAIDCDDEPCEDQQLVQE